MISSFTIKMHGIKGNDHFMSDLRLVCAETMEMNRK